MQVIGAGFGRTGTLSLKVALEQLLGGACYHMFEVLAKGERIRRWHAIATGADMEPDWRDMMSGFVAGVDWPVARYYRQLADTFPDAKVVLTVRDPDRWYESARETIYRMSMRLMKAPVKWLVDLHPHRRYMPPMAMAAIWGDTGHFDGRFEDRAHAISVYNAHIEEVKQTIPPERLLVFEVKQGWEPLCEFLGKPVPDNPFPDTNDRKQMNAMIARMTAVAWAVTPLTGPVALVRRLLGVRPPK